MKAILNALRDNGRQVGSGFFLLLSLFLFMESVFVFGQRTQLQMFNKINIRLSQDVKTIKEKSKATAKGVEEGKGGGSNEYWQVQMSQLMNKINTGVESILPESSEEEKARLGLIVQPVEGNTPMLSVEMKTHYADVLKFIDQLEPLGLYLTSLKVTAQEVTGVPVNHHVVMRLSLDNRTEEEKARKGDSTKVPPEKDPGKPSKDFSPDDDPFSNSEFQDNWMKAQPAMRLPPKDYRVMSLVRGEDNELHAVIKCKNTERSYRVGDILGGEADPMEVIGINESQVLLKKWDQKEKKLKRYEIHIAP